MNRPKSPATGGVALRVFGTLLLLGSLIFTVPIALWITVAIAAAITAVGTSFPRDYWWIDPLGWAVMIAVTVATFWAIYRLWRPIFKEDTE